MTDNSQLKIMSCLECLQSLSKEQRWEIFQKLGDVPDIEIERTYPFEDSDTEENIDIISRSINIIFVTPFGDFKISGRINEVSCYAGEVYLDKDHFCLMNNEKGCYLLSSYREDFDISKSNPIGEYKMNRKTAIAFVLALQEYLKETKFSGVDMSNFFIENEMT